MFDEFKSAFQRHNNAHVQLIIINVLLFVILGTLFVLSRWTGLETYFFILHDQFSIPPAFGEFLTRPWTIVTYSFAHSLQQLLHIIFNMLGLYWFGRLFVEYLGSDKLIALYVLGAIAGAVLYLLAYNALPVLPDFLANSPSGMVGASAAIFAILTAVAVLLPNYTFFLLFLGPVKIKYIAIVYIFISVLGSVGSNAGGEIAHLGGALIGYIYMKQLQAGTNIGGWVTVTLEFLKNLFKPKPKVKVTYRKEKNADVKKSGKPAVSQDEIDAILDKISAGGYDSLTQDEKEKLFNASKKQQDRDRTS
ncbi:MAG: rhomboid family intramembrane serine protease [Bacteroidota bacterium]